MKLLIATLSLSTSLVGCVPRTPSDPVQLVCIEVECQGGDKSMVDQTKASVANSMNVPGSAIFHDVYVTRRGQSRAVCGRVTAMNAFGGYPQAVRFYGGPEEADGYEVEIRKYPGRIQYLHRTWCEV